MKSTRVVKQNLNYSDLTPLRTTYHRQMWVAAVLIWKRKEINRKKTQKRSKRVHDLSLRMKTHYAEIEIYKGVCSYQKYFLENIGYRESDIACARMICYRKKSAVA